MAFRDLLENYSKLIPKIQAKHVTDMQVITDIAPGIQAVKFVAKTPWPLTNRIMIQVFYFHFDE
jgi:hypothetical protein